LNRQTFVERFVQGQLNKPEPDFPLAINGTQAAVLLPVVCHPDEVTLLFTERTSHLKHHAGQISFPGGKKDHRDPNLLFTAIRETHEEIGLKVSPNQIIGNLPAYRTISAFEVFPFIGLIDPDPLLKPNQNEVASTFEIPITFLLNKNNHFTHWFERSKQRWPVYFIHWQDKQIWGATAAFIRNLANICEGYVPVNCCYTVYMNS
jgi:8-oxo-dGTP pyrophosphatase MutT (NUDIX family)